ncbi:MAG: L,D-transpeptidase, partial [Acidimicrobiales bacterium]
AKPYNSNGPYGAYQISFTGFSTVYESFGSGNGQVAMHGTNRPELIGSPASHGCVRMTNAAVTEMIGLAPTGTPVDVVP